MISSISLCFLVSILEPVSSLKKMASNMSRGGTPTIASACKGSVRYTEAEDLVQAKVDLWYCKALHFMTCHGCCNCERHLFEMSFIEAIEGRVMASRHDANVFRSVAVLL